MKAITSYLLLLTVGLIVSSFRGEDVISGDKEHLIGKYEFICTYKDNVKTDASASVDSYSLKISKKSELVVYKNGKKQNKFEFSSVEIPVEYDYDYVMFHKKDQFYPMFYKGDTVVIHIYPFEFQDNYFRKVN